MLVTFIIFRSLGFSLGCWEIHDPSFCPKYNVTRVSRVEDLLCSILSQVLQFQGVEHKKGLAALTLWIPSLSHSPFFSFLWDFSPTSYRSWKGVRGKGEATQLIRHIEVEEVCVCRRQVWVQHCNMMSVLESCITLHWGAKTTCKSLSWDICGVI